MPKCSDIMRGERQRQGDMRSRMQRSRWTLAALLCLGIGAAPAFAEEIYSNGYGGGRWSETATWRGGKVPGAKDTVVVSARDEVIFDGNDETQATCAELAIDPRGKLTFKIGGRHVLSVAGKVESYGTIQLNTRASREAYQALRLVGEKEEDRVLKLKENSALLVYGNESLSQTQRNAVLRTGSLKTPEAEANSKKQADAESKQPAAKDAKQPDPAPPGKILAPDKTMLDLQHARISGLSIEAEDIDNTGYRGNERLNIIGNVFTDDSSILISKCDSAVVSKNVFRGPEKSRNGTTAIHLESSKMTRVAGNQIERYRYGMYTFGAADTILKDNTFNDCQRGLYHRGSGMMAQDNVLTNCDVGFWVLSGSGVFERITIRGARTYAIYAYGHADMQFTNCHIVDFAGKKDTRPVAFEDGSYTLMNSNITAKMLQLSKKQDRHVQVKWVRPLCVRVKGKVPAVAQVMVRTVGNKLPVTARDPNVRNSPAPLDAKGLTPRGDLVHLMTVQGATYTNQKGMKAAPEYVLTVQQPPTKEGEKAKILARKNVQPDESWYRPDLTSTQATVTIELDR